MAFENLPIDAKQAALVELYVRAELELRLLVQEALAEGRMGGLAFRRRQLERVREVLRRLDVEGAAKSPALVRGAYAFGIQLSADPKGRTSADFGGALHQQALEVLGDNLRRRLQDTTILIGRRVEDVFRREGLRHTALHQIQATTRKEASKALEEALIKRGLSAFTDKAGREWSLGTYTKMAIRTTTREAASEGTRHGMIDRGYDLIAITSHKHKHDVCSPYDGKTFSLTGQTPGYPVIDRLPPFHPNCAHVATVSPAQFQLELKALRGQAAA